MEDTPIKRLVRIMSDISVFPVCILQEVLFILQIFLKSHLGCHISDVCSHTRPFYGPPSTGNRWNLWWFCPLLSWLGISGIWTTVEKKEEFLLFWSRKKTKETTPLVIGIIALQGKGRKLQNLERYRLKHFKRNSDTNHTETVMFYQKIRFVLDYWRYKTGLLSHFLSRYYPPHCSNEAEIAARSCPQWKR